MDTGNFDTFLSSTRIDRSLKCCNQMSYLDARSSNVLLIHQPRCHKIDASVLTNLLSITHRSHGLADTVLRAGANTIVQACGPQVSVHGVAAVLAVLLVYSAADGSLGRVDGDHGYQDSCDNAQSNDDL